jgi:hypothetical protein
MDHRSLLRRALFLTLSGALASACVVGAENGANAPRYGVSADRIFPEPGHIPAMARALLKDRMRLHGDDMSDLMWAVLFLDHQSARAIAEDIAATPRFARPTAGDDEILNASLSPEFFDMQDALTEDAKALADAASKGEERRVAELFGRLATTCVRCHVAYLHEPVDAPDPPPEQGEPGG